MGREGDNNDGPTHETLSFAEFVTRGRVEGISERAVLVVSATGGGQQVFALNRNPTVIGRSNNADLVLADPGISDLHARIIKHSFGYTIEDMGSAEGTFLHERRVNHARLLSGDTIHLGAMTLTFLDERASAHEDPSTALVSVRSRVRDLVLGSTAVRHPYAPSPRLRPIPSPPPIPTGRNRWLSESDEAAPSGDDLLRKILGVSRYLKRRAWPIVAFAGLGLASGAASYEILPPVRAAYCMLALHPGSGADPSEPDTRQNQSDAMQFLASAERAFTSQAGIVATLKLVGVPNPSEAQAEGIAKQLRFENVGNNTYTATLSPGIFSGRGDWHLQLLDAHVTNYIDTEMKKTLKASIAEVDFLRSQTEAAERRLGEIAQEAIQFREAHSEQILAQTTLTAGSPAALESKRIDASGRANRLAGELEGVRSQLARGSVLSQAKAQSAHADREALSQADRKMGELRAQGFADGHPDVQRLLTEQKNLQRSVDDHLHSDVTQFEKRSNVAYDTLQGQTDQLKAQLRAARAEQGTIEAGMRSLRAVSSQSPKVNARLDELLRMKEEVERQHGLLFDRWKRAEVQLQLERVFAASRYEIVIPPRLELPPGRKAFGQRLAIGLSLGLLLATVVLGGAELRRQFIRVAAEGALAGLLALLTQLPLGI